MTGTEAADGSPGPHGSVDTASALTTDPDMIRVGLPATASSAGFVLALCGGRDQVAVKVRDAGWTAFEPPLPEYVVTVLARQPGVFVDVGANTGFYTLLAASASPEQPVLALEPDPAVFSVLERNVAHNRMSRRVALLRCAASDAIGSAPLFIPTQEHGLVETSSSLCRDFKDRHSAITEVRTTTIDRVVMQPSTVLRRVTAIKIDVEGHEGAVLDGASDTMRWHRPVVFVEVLPGADITRLERVRRRHDYVDLVLHPKRAPASRDAIAFDPDCWNHALVPRERLSSLFEAV